MQNIAEVWNMLDQCWGVGAHRSALLHLSCFRMAGQKCALNADAVASGARMGYPHCFAQLQLTSPHPTPHPLFTLLHLLSSAHVTMIMADNSQHARPHFPFLSFTTLRTLAWLRKERDNWNSTMKDGRMVVVGVISGGVSWATARFAQP